ncbi:NrdH-redoxin [Bacillus coagulans]|nr:glutaredoxin family protein [Heyndrickxia coagulans]NCG68117.1 NrdH-redoxin [Heyndrickxia coagulans]
MTEQVQTIVVWSKQGCQYCQAVKDYLKEQNLAYTDVDITEQDHLRDVLEAKYGVRYVPVVEIGSREGRNYYAVTEIGVEHLEKALGKGEKIHGAQ